jgi:HEAT repeat protein
MVDQLQLMEMKSHVENIQSSLDDPEAREAAALDLNRVIEIAGNLLENLLKEEDRDTRDMALHGLQRLQGSAKIIIPYLKDDNYETRWVAAECLKSWQTPEVTHALIEQFGVETVWNVRAAIIKSLGFPESPSHEAILMLLKAGHDEDAFVRDEAKRALAKLAN